MHRNMRAIRKVKVLGYPFAGGQGKSGVELTPAWLKKQKWFTKLAIEYEDVNVSSPNSNL